MVPKSLTPVTSALEKFLLREEDDEEECDGERNSSSAGRPSNPLYIPKSASADAALSAGKVKEESEESAQNDNHPESGLEKY